jgi:hypothetical protein
MDEDRHGKRAGTLGYVHIEQEPLPARLAVLNVPFHFGANGEAARDQPTAAHNPMAEFHAERFAPFGAAGKRAVGCAPAKPRFLAGGG